ncbi:hypothetical protein Dimus_017098 [Dionaea muscipula]
MARSITTPNQPSLTPVTNKSGDTTSTSIHSAHFFTFIYKPINILYSPTNMQMKDQIGTYTYFPWTLMQRAAGGFRALNIYRRAVIAVIPLPYLEAATGDFTLLVGDWFKADHKVLQQTLESLRTTD